MKKSIKEFIHPETVSQAEIVSDRIMNKKDEVVLRNREDYFKYKKEEGNYFLKKISVLETDTGFKNTKTNSKDIEEAQFCFIYLADLELVRYSKKGYPIYKIINEPVYDGYLDGVKIKEENHHIICENEYIDDDGDMLEELDISN